MAAVLRAGLNPGQLAHTQFSYIGPEVLGKKHLVLLVSTSSYALLCHISLAPLSAECFSCRFMCWLCSLAPAHLPCPTLGSYKQLRSLGAPECENVGTHHPLKGDLTQRTLSASHGKLFRICYSAREILRAISK